MTLDTTDRTLLALFRLSRDTGHIDAASLGQATGQTPTLAARSLVALERAGWVDASRARLTMLGLARAAQLSARSAEGGGGLPAIKPLAPARTRMKPPVAARPCARDQSAARPCARDQSAARPCARDQSAARPARDESAAGQEELVQHVAGAGVGQ